MRIFVSHSVADKAICDEVVAALREAGADVWYDEHDLGPGDLLREIMKQLVTRPVALIGLSAAAFASDWVQRECDWAYSLYRREPNRLILPVVVGNYQPRDFNTLLYLEYMWRIEGPGNHPYPTSELIARTLQALALTPAGAMAVAVTPQPGESLADLLTQGKGLQAQNKHTEALPFFERATRLDATSFDAWVNVAYTLDALKRYDEALAALDRALALDANNAAVWNSKGVALYLKGLSQDSKASVGMFEDALKMYERALALDEKYVFSWNNTGLALHALTRYDEARVAYDRGIAIEETPLRLRNKAITLRALGRVREAEEAEWRAQALDE